MVLFFAFGSLIYTCVLLVNAVAILSEDRFLARVGLSNSVNEPAFGASSGGGDASIKSKLVNLMTSVRTLMRIPLIGINVLIILYELALG
ncbi:Yos1-like protein [Tricladium varicosporioides]|nr:Yos1-like protein [Hymenoscyphus varicosporioides]